MVHRPRLVAGRMSFAVAEPATTVRLAEPATTVHPAEPGTTVRVVLRGGTAAS